MLHELEPTRANRLRVAAAFRHSKRVDYSIDCVVEGQMGRVFVDSPNEPAAFCIATGPFRYFAGDARNPGALEMVRSLEPRCLLMPSPLEWVDLAREVYSGRLADFTRYSFSPDRLSADHLRGLLNGTKYRDSIAPVTADRVASIVRQGEDYLDISEFDSPQDFEERGLGYAVLAGDEAIGTAYSALVCSRGIEISIYVGDQYRRHGVATALACRLLLECLGRGLRPNWDAANPESYKLARKLGFEFVETYDAYYVEV
jgi:GNAT superfamily N-acetyltransferase